VHMISPNPTMVVNMLEEGIAAMFSIMYMRDIMDQRMLPAYLL
jgi:hypothetical protein